MLTSRMWRLWILSLVAYLPMGCSLADSSQGSLSHRDTQIQGALVQGPVLEFDGVCLATHRGSLSSALHLIDTARECMHMMEFVNYDDGSVSILLDQVIQAIVLADEESGHTDPALTRIAALGVQIRLDSHQVTTHNKPLMVDDHTLVGSHNLSGSALDQNIESAASPMAFMAAFKVGKGR
jgi:phosphatidylserine/phosphatidylglycerophosphate/cardiolipin synthase-like enzyme